MESLHIMAALIGVTRKPHSQLARLARHEALLPGLVRLLREPFGLDCLRLILANSRETQLPARASTVLGSCLLFNLCMWLPCIPGALHGQGALEEVRCGERLLVSTGIAKY